MKPHRFFATAALAASLAAVSFQANAECRGHSGYVFVSAYCSTQVVNHPSNPCERRRNEDASVVGFFSYVVHDSVDNRIYPAGTFFDEIQNQYDLTQNGHVSACYATRAEAERARRHAIANSKRQGNRIRSVSMPDT